MALLSACASVPRGTPAESDAAKRFDAPPSDVASLYIYRTTSYANTWRTVVNLVGNPLKEFSTDLPAGTFLKVASPPGPAEINCVVANLPDRHQIEIVAGQIRYFEVTLRPSMYSPYCLVQETTPERAQPLVKGMTLVEPM
jgi:hypothetical protein